MELEPTKPELQDDWLRFETLLSDLSARFMRLKPAQADEEIERALREVTEFFHAHRCGLLEVFENQKIARLTHAWYADGVRQVPAGNNCAEGLSWSFERLSVQKQAIAFNHLSDLPPDAAADIPVYEAMGVFSTLMIPLFIREDIRHIVVLQTMEGGGTLSPEYIPRLRLLAEIMVHAIERRDAEAQLRLALEEVQRLRDRLHQENIHLRREVKELRGRSPIVGQSPALRRVLVQVEQVAATGSTVLLLGETGTGKELFASAIHERSPRNGRTMIRMNCAAIPATLIESELFGREKGAYTGAVSQQIGRFEMAHGSTLFLDEIGELPMDLQVKLLRVLQDKHIERLGNPKPIPVDVRIIAATNKDLERAVHEGKFREDLYYRFNVFPITIPPLRERREDIPLLTLAFLEEFSAALGKHVDAISPSNMDRLVGYPWPGNVREMRNIIERAMILATGSKLEIELPNAGGVKCSHDVKLEDIERKHCLNVLDMTGWRVRGKNGAAEMLGLKPTTLASRMAKLGIQRPIS
jgi:transcriptional regulator with GAF, ATPase, and Fis domain